jgi:thiol-disulfide isomerase/thioredoxin
MIPSIAIRLGSAFVLTLIAGRFLIKDKEQRNAPEAVLSNGIFVYLLSLKLSLLVTNFSSVQNEIMYLLYGWGSTINQAIAVVSVLGYFSWFIIIKSMNQKNDLVFLSGSLATFAGVFFLSSFLINDASKAQNVDISVLNGRVDIYENPIEIDDDKVIILNFWATWCPPCRAEMPDLNAFNQNFPEANFIGINNIASEKSGMQGVKEFMQSNNYTFTVLADKASSLTTLFEVSSFPTTVVVSPKGDVLAKKVGVVSESWLEQWME